MKKMTKKMIALFMTLLMVAAILPITASAAQCARIVVELKEPYYGENLSEILPEIEIEAAYPFIEGYAFTVYYDHASDEDAEAAAEKLASNPIVKAATYCPYDEIEIKATAIFKVTLVKEYFGDSDNYMRPEKVEIGKLFPDIRISKANTVSRSYNLWCDVSSVDEISEIYEEIKANPFVTQVYFHVADNGEYAITGGVKVTTKNKCTTEELSEIISDIEFETVNPLYGGFSFGIPLKDKTLKGTLEAVAALKKNPYIVSVEYTNKLTSIHVEPFEMDESKLIAPALPEVTVETALAALRITAGLSEVKNGVYDYRLADAIWQYDCDGDKVITVTDALSLLRIAAKLD